MYLVYGTGKHELPRPRLYDLDVVDVVVYRPRSGLSTLLIGLQLVVALYTVYEGKDKCRPKLIFIAQQQALNRFK